VTQKVDAIYTGGVLKPRRQLHLKDNERVRLTVETIDEPQTDREAAIARLNTGVADMHFYLLGPLPPREELHNRA